MLLILHIATRYQIVHGKNQMEVHKWTEGKQLRQSWKFLHLHPSQQEHQSRIHLSRPRLNRYLKKRSIRKDRLGGTASVYATAVFEYLKAKILELTGRISKDLHHIRRITPKHLQLAIRNDKQLDLLIRATIPEGGVIPRIHRTLVMDETAYESTAQWCISLLMMTKHHHFQMTALYYSVHCCMMMIAGGCYQSLLLAFDTDSLAATASGLGVLSPHLEAPLVTQTPVAPDLEEPLDVLPQLGLQHVRSHLQVLPLLVVALPVEEPPGHGVALGVSDDIGDGVALGLTELSGPELGVDAEDLADEEAEATADSLDLVKSEGDGALAVDVGVEDTVDVLEGVIGVFDDQGHLCGQKQQIFQSIFHQQVQQSSTPSLDMRGRGEKGWDTGDMRV